MGLIDERHVGTETVEFEDGSWYELRKELGWYHRSMVSDMTGIVINIPGSKLREGDDIIADDDTIPATLQQLPDVQLMRLEAYLKSWSHTDADGRHIRITRNSIKRVPPKHARRLLDRIAELQAIQDGPQDGDPLAGS